MNETTILNHLSCKFSEMLKCDAPTKAKNLIDNISHPCKFGEHWTFNAAALHSAPIPETTFGEQVLCCVVLG